MKRSAKTLHLAAYLVVCLCFISPTAKSDRACLVLWQSADADRDGLSDTFENCLAERHAPVLYMPFDLDWTWPTSVDQYLPAVELRFNHWNGCDDDHIAHRPTMQGLLGHTHQKKRGTVVFPPWESCTHSGAFISSSLLGNNPWDGEHHFFLELYNSSSRGGSGNPGADWKVYQHSYPSSAGVDIEYWYFFAYNDSVATINHEGDWEHVKVRLDASLNVYQVVYYHHNDSTARSAGNVRWYDKPGGHPLVWIADGSHASYWVNGSDCNNSFSEGWDTSCQTIDAYRWFTWAGGKASQAGYQGFGLVNVGETANPLNGQHWIQYSGRWGEIGEFEFTSGPRTPSAQGSWGDTRVATNPHPFRSQAAGLVLSLAR